MRYVLLFLMPALAHTANFAKMEGGTVQQVIVASPAFVQTLSGTFIETFGDGQRGNFAGPGYTYDSENDVFIAPKPYPSWKLNNQWQWEAPAARPNNGKFYRWNEQQGRWDSED